jgi:hypothetical protein
MPLTYKDYVMLAEKFGKTGKQELLIFADMGVCASLESVIVAYRKARSMQAFIPYCSSMIAAIPIRNTSAIIIPATLIHLLPKLAEHFRRSKPKCRSIFGGVSIYIMADVFQTDIILKQIGTGTKNLPIIVDEEQPLTHFKFSFLLADN